jgi:hypothetical protein
MHRAASYSLARLEAVHAVEPHAIRFGIVRIEIGQRRRNAAAVPLLAVHGAGVTTDAGIQIDHQAKLLPGCRLRQVGHRFFSAASRNCLP